MQRLQRTLLAFLLALSAPLAAAAEIQAPADLRLVATIAEATQVMTGFKFDAENWAESYDADGTIQGFDKSYNRTYSGRWSVTEEGGVAVVFYDYPRNQYDVSSVLGIATEQGEQRMYYLEPGSRDAKGWARMVPIGN